MVSSPLFVILALLIGLASSFTQNCGDGFANKLTSSRQRHRHRHGHRSATAIASTVVAGQDEEKQSHKQLQLHECKACEQKFSSRNALFRHLRGEDEASAACSLSMDRMSTSEEVLLITTAIRYGYYDGTNSTVSSNEAVANVIHQAFIQHVHTFLTDVDGMAQNFTISTSALTYSTATKSRQPSLRQDEEVAGATSEVLSFNYRLACSPTAVSKWKVYANSDLPEHMQTWLNDAAGQIVIQLHQFDALVPRSAKLFAERSCTQSSYRYMLPVRWILSGRQAIFDDLENDAQMGDAVAVPRFATYREHQPRSKAAPPTPPFVKSLKRSLKRVESKTVPNRRSRRQAERNARDDTADVDDGDLRLDNSSDGTPIRLAPGRFGQLWRKRRQCFSNFASPKLSGMAASPAHEAVWRTMDRAKIVGFYLHESDDKGAGANDMHILLEFSADGFVVGQIPRIISALVGIANGWLPANFFDIATRPDVYMPGPMAPPNLDSRLYFHTARFHFHELIGNSDSFEKTIRTGSPSEQKWEAQLRKRLLGKFSSTDTSREDDWLVELREVICPSLRRQIATVEAEETHQSHSSENTPYTLPFVDTDAPDEYSKTLHLLRGVVKDERWPATSDARSRVIKTPGGSSKNVLATKKKATTTAFPGNSISSGSFTVVNEDIWGSDDAPLANSLFPELAKAIFQLEKDIILLSNPPLPAADGMNNQSSLRRSPSTHCAVNRNAQFTPHVDSGRGQGQSFSMIVGLGNYTGGEILVEGKKYGIRYHPLEFDGWKQLHWTAPFNGERYSLVFFTPEINRNSGGFQSSEQSGMSRIDDDRHASQLAREHSNSVPFLPELGYREDSTDALVIAELLDRRKGSAYVMEPNTQFPSGFTLKGHTKILDVGAHIGVFSRLAIAEGAGHVIAYEPESSNFELLSQNLNITHPTSSAILPTIELHRSAVAHGNDKQRTLVQARNENNGKQNTWRHSLEEYTQYVDRSNKLPSTSQKATLERVTVPCISFFGSGDEKGALVAGVTFVKLDCEGAEIDILLSDDASQASSWLDATHLVVKWSFTKERRVSVFHKAMNNLREAGFTIYYEGMGSWWDTEGVLWPYPKDTIVFQSEPYTEHKTD